MAGNTGYLRRAFDWTIRQLAPDLTQKSPEEAGKWIADNKNRGALVRNALDYAREQNPDFGPDLTGLDLQDADFRNCDLRNARIFDPGNPDKKRTDLGYADLSGARLMGIDFGTAFVNGASFRGADLRGADLSQAGMTPNTDLRGAQLDQTKLRRDGFSNYIGLLHVEKTDLALVDHGDEGIMVHHNGGSFKNIHDYMKTLNRHDDPTAGRDLAVALSHAAAVSKTSDGEEFGQAEPLFAELSKKYPAFFRPLDAPPNPAASNTQKAGQPRL